MLVVVSFDKVYQSAWENIDQFQAATGLGGTKCQLAHHAAPETCDFNPPYLAALKREPDFSILLESWLNIKESAGNRLQSITGITIRREMQSEIPNLSGQIIREDQTVPAAAAQ